mmetsp:Transcript_27457/g.31664  ORF Transcript_27457/g.31664 Transcript_27457/m.31664 type:complete len:275 (-) Transcript_27457:175-999(-)
MSEPQQGDNDFLCLFITDEQVKDTSAQKCKPSTDKEVKPSNSRHAICNICRHPSFLTTGKQLSLNHSTCQICASQRCPYCTLPVYSLSDHVKAGYCKVKILWLREFGRALQRAGQWFVELLMHPLLAFGYILFAILLLMDDCNVSGKTKTCINTTVVILSPVITPVASVFYMPFAVYDYIEKWMSDSPVGSCKSVFFCISRPQIQRAVLIICLPLFLVLTGPIRVCESLKTKSPYRVVAYSFRSLAGLIFFPFVLFDVVGHYVYDTHVGWRIED